MGFYKKKAQTTVIDVGLFRTPLSLPQHATLDVPDGQRAGSQIEDVPQNQIGNGQLKKFYLLSKIKSIQNMRL